MTHGAERGAAPSLDAFGFTPNRPPSEAGLPPEIALSPSAGPLVGGARWIAAGVGDVPDIGLLEGDVVYRLPGVCQLRIPIDGHEIRLHVEPGADAEAVRWLLVRGIMPRVLQLRGVPCLHASAVAGPAGLICFAAESGGGKSALAAAMVRRGYRLVGDDIVPVRIASETPMGGPGLEDIWLHPDVAERVGVGLGRPAPGPPSEKRAWRPPEDLIESTPQPIRTVFVLRARPPRNPPAPAARRGPVLAAPAAFRSLVEQSMWIHPAVPRAMERAMPVLERMAQAVVVRSLFVQLDRRGLEAAARLVARECRDA